MSNNEFIKNICEILHIREPKTQLVQKLNTNTQLAAYDINKDILYIKKSLHDERDLMFAIAHELRHSWQYHNQKYLDEYKSSTELNIEEYNKQEAEVDANAFALIVMQTFFGQTPLFSGMPYETIKMIKDKAEIIIAEELM